MFKSKRVKKGPGWAKRLVRLILLLALCAGVGAGLWAGWQKCKMTSLFTCTSVLVKGNALVPQEQILDKIAVVPGRSIYAYNRDVIIQSLAGNPCIKSCRVERRPFSTLVIRIEERNPMAYINLDQLYLVDCDRMLLPVPHNGTVFDLPVITGLTVATARAGQRVFAPVLDTALTLLSAVFSLRPDLVERISEINVAQPRNITLVLDAPAMKIFLGPSVTMETLQKLNIWETYDPHSASEIEYIDLRFAGQIVIKRKTS